MKNTRVAILTFHRSDNYGSVLQAYALNHYLNAQGCVAETLDFRTERQEEVYSKFFQKSDSALSIVKNLYTLRYYRQMVSRRKLYEEFRRENINCSSKALWESVSEEVGEEYDFFVFGSDQIWNTTCSDFDETYLGNFVNNKKKCISFAASVGRSNLSDKDKEKFKQVSGFLAVSVREQEAAEFLQPIVKRHIEVVCDPVFLLSKNEWEIFLKRKIEHPYIASYIIGETAGARRCCKALQNKKGLPTHAFYKSLRNVLDGAKPEYSASPTDFLSGLYFADYVCTTSFHAAAFSILFSKKFWVILEEDRESKSQTRLINLMRYAGLEDRVLYEKDLSSDIDFDKEIDYVEVNKRMGDFIEKSKIYLKTNLKL